MKRNLYLNFLFQKKKIFSVFFYLFFTINFVFSQTNFTITSTGGGTWVVPCDVTSVTVKVWGGGGAGGGSAAFGVRGGGGGAGGAYATSVLTVTPGSTITYSVGAGATGTTNAGAAGGDTWFLSTGTLLAKGGAGGAAPNGGTVAGGAGTTAGSIGTTVLAGVSGGNGTNITSGAGGQGGNAGGAGGAGGVITGANGGVGAVPGGGGGGAFVNNGTDRLGGNGGNGQVTITYTSALPVPSCYKTYTTIAPITKVAFAGIDNTTATTSTVANEIFCAAANVMQGQSYLISVKGNTLSTASTKYVDYYTVFIDWNRDGDFLDANETKNIGTLYGSTGIDATVLNDMITVPLTATVGSTKMRIVKNRSAYTNSCTNDNYGQAEDYTVIVSAIPACAGVPVGGTATANPTSGATSSVFVASVSGATAATGLTYQWQSAPSATGPWTNIAYTGASANITAPAAATTTYYRRLTICGGNTTPSTVTSYTTTSPTPCLVYTAVTAADGNENYDFIQKVSFLGTLHDTNNNSLWSTAPPGYQDFTNLTDKSIQATGNGVNVYVEAPQETNFKAWIDWNNDGVFTDSPVTINASGVWTGGERVYSSGTSSVHSTTFGFVVPTNVPAGDYKIRIKGDYKVSGSTSFSSCADFNNGGETEDYKFTVITNCSAIVSNVTQVGTRPCGGNAVQLRATGSATTTQFRWYDELGVLQATTPAVLSAGVTTSDWSTPVLTTTKKYFVAAYNGTCESLIKIPIEARVLLVPSVSFSSSNPKICGEKSVVTVTAAGGNQIDYPVDEHFDSGSLGVFTNVNNTNNGATNNAKTQWQNKTSTFIPAQLTWFPAIASGTNGNGFVICNSDINVFPIQHSLVSPTIDTSSFINLTLEFRMYFSRYNQNGVDPSTEYVELEISTNNGASWTSIDHITNDVGIGTNFEKKTYNFNAYINQTQFKFRIRYYAGEWFDGVALDDIVLFGEKPFNTSFDWSSDNSIQVYSDPAATIPYTGTPINTIYVKPNATELESYNSWDLSATALLDNGCSTTGDITINNDTKVWNIVSNNDWKTLNWKPDVSIPDINKCVIVKTPVNLFTQDGFAKNLVVKNGGSLNVKPGISLTVAEEVTNETAANKFIVESDANLVQIVDLINSGNITVQRNSRMKRLDYTYWGTPVNGQKLRSFSPSTLNTRFYVYNELNDYFDGIFVHNTYPTDGMYPTPTLSLTPVEPEATYDFVKAKGYAVRSPNNFTTTVTDFMGSFVGVPNNGGVTINIKKSANTVIGGTTYVHGINLISNPYPSNIDLDKFFTANPSLQKEVRFWTNINPNPAMQGSQYPKTGTINNYAIYNPVGGLPSAGAACNSAFTTCSPAPTNIVKVGQGFMVNLASSVAPGTTQVTFNNSMRVAANSGSFFNAKMANATKDRYWLELKTPLDFVTPLLVGYVEGSTNAYEEDYDAELNVIGADSFYTTLDNKKLGIQGRQFPLNTEDVVSLGAIFYAAGVHTISLGNREGIFANGQEIFLRDKLANTVTNLSQQSYTFNAQAGEVNDRFEILYNYRTLGTDDNLAKTDVVMYKENNDYVIKSPEEIKMVKLYDASGKLISTSKVTDKIYRLEVSNFAKGVYTVEILTAKKQVTKKIIK